MLDLSMSEALTPSTSGNMAWLKCLTDDHRSNYRISKTKKSKDSDTRYMRLNIQIMKNKIDKYIHLLSFDPYYTAVWLYTHIIYHETPRLTLDGCGVTVYSPFSVFTCLITIYMYIITVFLLLCHYSYDSWNFMIMIGLRAELRKDVSSI